MLVAMFNYLTPRQLEIFKMRLCRMDAGSGQIFCIYSLKPYLPLGLPWDRFLDLKKNYITFLVLIQLT